MTRNDVTKCKVAVLCGGWSDERDVSLLSGGEVRTALQQAGFEHVDLMDIAAPDFIGTISTGGYDVAFVALHGKYGEDGSIQGLLDLRAPWRWKRMWRRRCTGARAFLWQTMSLSMRERFPRMRSLPRWWIASACPSL